jgi:hypothetical protein
MVSHFSQGMKPIKHVAHLRRRTRKSTFPPSALCGSSACWEKAELGRCDTAQDTTTTTGGTDQKPAWFFVFEDIADNESFKGVADRLHHTVCGASVCFPWY